MKIRFLSLLAVIAMCAPTAHAQLIYDFDSNLDAVFSAPVGTNSDTGTWGPGDWFGEINHVTNAGSVPFTMIDESAGSFPADTLGVISESKTDTYFASTDTENGSNTGPLSATWTFDISTLTGPLTFSVDMGAMGDFEDTANNDEFSLTYSVDGSPAADLFAITIDTDGDALYILDSGLPQILNDPVQVDGVDLVNGLTTKTSSVAIPAGNSLVVTWTAATDGGSEGIALDNLTVTPVPEPATLALMLFGLAGVAAGRRRS